MKVVLWRHGLKTHGNSDRIPAGFLKYDPLLVPPAVASIQASLGKIAANPSLMIVSPYIRARETADIVAASLAASMPILPRAYDVRIGEYLGNQRRTMTPTVAVNHVATSTAYLLHSGTTFDGTQPRESYVRMPNTYEGMDELKGRVGSFLRSLKAYATTHPDDTVYVVTHGLTINVLEEVLKGTKTTDGIDYAGTWEVDL